MTSSSLLLEARWVQLFHSKMHCSERAAQAYLAMSIDEQENEI